MLNLRPVGCNCYYNAIACGFDLRGDPEKALAFTAYDFHYESAVKFATTNVVGSIESYISRTNRLIIDRPIQSEYILHLYSIRDIFYDRCPIYRLSVPDAIVGKASFIDELLDTTDLVIVSVDVVAFREIYRNAGVQVPLRSHSLHLVVILKSDKDNYRLCDTLFGADLIVPKSVVIYAFESSSVKSLYTLENSGLDISNNSLLQVHLKNSLCANDLGENSFDALRTFSVELDSITHELMEQYGSYSAQFMSYILNPVRMERVGCVSLYKYLYDYCGESIFKELFQLAKEPSELWFQLDACLDASVLKGICIKDSHAEIQAIVDKIVELESHLYDYMKMIAL